jgi:DNA-binding beta-propeller fold protein YncE
MSGPGRSTRCSGPVVPSGLGPYDLANGPGGVLYASTLWGARVLSVNLATGAVSVVAGTGRQTFNRRGEYAGDGGPADSATFLMAAGIAIDAEGSIYVADFGNNSIRMISSTTGVINAVAGHIPQSPAHCC